MGTSFNSWILFSLPCYVKWSHVKCRWLHPSFSASLPHYLHPQCVKTTQLARKPYNQPLHDVTQEGRAKRRRRWRAGCTRCAQHFLKRILFLLMFYTTTAHSKLAPPTHWHRHPPWTQKHVQMGVCFVFGTSSTSPHTPQNMACFTCFLCLLPLWPTTSPQTHETRLSGRVSCVWHLCRPSDPSPSLMHIKHCPRAGPWPSGPGLALL